MLKLMSTSLAQILGSLSGNHNVGPHQRQPVSEEPRRLAASSITLCLLSILQSLLPAHAAAKDSPRTLACRKVVMNQGWSKDIIKESFSAIGKMDRKLYPDVGPPNTKLFHNRAILTGLGHL